MWVEKSYKLNHTPIKAKKKQICIPQDPLLTIAHALLIYNWISRDQNILKLVCAQQSSSVSLELVVTLVDDETKNWHKQGINYLLSESTWKAFNLWK